jgi:uncharacterized protein
MPVVEQGAILLIHQFTHGGYYIIMDIPSGAVHLVDPLVYDLCAQLSLPLSESCPDHISSTLRHKYLQPDINEAYREIFQLHQDKQLFSEEIRLPEDLIKPSHPPIKALCLHVSHDCNLRCRYCFAQTGDFGTVRSLMSAETARQAIDFVVAHSQNRKNIEIDFFGGEPLMAWDTVKETIAYARSLESGKGKQFRFTITTNGVLLNEDTIAFINTHMDNVVLSLDGRQAVNDAMRCTISGQGSYEMILPRFQELVAKRPIDKRYYIRGTFTHHNLDFHHDVLSIYENGFDQISVEPVSAPDNYDYAITEADLDTIRAEYWLLTDILIKMRKNQEHLSFFHFEVDLAQGPCIVKRLRGCGAGSEYVAITPEGDIYPCHQFVGNPSFLMGNIHTNTLDSELVHKFSSVHIYSREECGSCWAKYYCSGGCSAANYHRWGTIEKPDPLGCEFQKMRLECAIFMACEKIIT